MERPPALQPGDTIGIIAPASNVKPELLAAGCRELESLGFEVRLRDDITVRYAYTAGLEPRRSEELSEMLADPKVKAIFCARGGYGSKCPLP